MRNALLVFGSILLFGSSGFLRKLSVDRIHPYQLQVVAGIVYAIELPVWLWLISRDKSIGSYDTAGVGFGLACIVTHVLAAVMLGILLKTSDSPGTMAAIVAINPIVTAMLSWMVLGEEYTLRKIIATVVTMVGIVMFTL